MMHFLYEELFQWLPRRQNDTTESICIAKYPVEEVSWESAESEKKFELVMSAIAALRSLSSDYSIKEATGFVYSSIKFDS